MSTIAYVLQLPKCDFCKEDPTKDDAYNDVDAHYDGKTIQGPWAYMCTPHYTVYGVGLGLGLGQRLIVKETE